MKALIFLRILVSTILDTDRPQTEMCSLLHVFINRRNRLPEDNDIRHPIWSRFTFYRRES